MLITHPLTLSDLRPGQQARIVQVNGPAEIKHRILEMGLTSGTLVRLIRLAPLGDPLELQLRGYRLSLRKNEADAIWVEAA